MNIVKINPLSIIPAPWNTRSKLDEAGINSLAESIKHDGIIEMPNCIRNANGDLVCYNGNRRIAAACLLGLDEIEVNVDDITEEAAKVRTVTANLQREEDEPLLAAKVIAELGGDPEIIASKLGKTVAWVKRRAKLNKLTNDIKGVADNLTLDALEHLCELNEDQQAKIVKSINRRITYSNGNRVTWSELRYDVNALVADLDEAKFNTTECVGCNDRTGANWFADEDDGLGRCLNCACYKRKAAEHKAKLIAEAIPEDAEREEIDYPWQLPTEVKDGGCDKRTAHHPCAWYWFDDGEIKVKWGCSRKAIEAEREAEEERRAADRAKAAEVREREDAIEEKLVDWLKGNDGEAEVCMAIRRLLGGASNDAADFVVEKMWDSLSDWWGNVSPILKAFPEFAELAEISREDVEWYLAHDADDDN